ncbi:unnamed protein product, partial [Discosporangium mesarthrocarpum]
VHARDDEGLESDLTNYIFVRPVNDPPTLVLSGVGGEAAAQAIAGSGEALRGIRVDDVDAAADSSLCLNMEGLEDRNALTLELSPEEGTMWLRTTEAVGVRVIGDSAVSRGETMTLQASLGALRAALEGGQLFYRAPHYFSGPDTVRVSASDKGNCGSGPIGVSTGTMAIEVAPFVPPLSVELDGLAVDSVLYTLEGTPLMIPTPVVSGRSADSRDLVEATVVAVGGNVTLALPKPLGVDFLGGTGPTGSRVWMRGSPRALTAAMNGLTFHPRPHFSGLWKFNDSAGGTPVRSWKHTGAQALARVDVAVAPEGAGVRLTSPFYSLTDSPTAARAKISVGWVNDPPTIRAPVSVTAAWGTDGIPVSGVSIVDPDVVDGSLGRGQLEVNVSAVAGGYLVIDAHVAARNGLVDMGDGEDIVRLLGEPEYVNNILTTLTFFWGNNSLGTGQLVDSSGDEIEVHVSDLGFTGAGGEGRAHAVIAVEVGEMDDDDRAAAVAEAEQWAATGGKTFLSLVQTEEDVDVLVPGLERVIMDAGDREVVTVDVSAREGLLVLGPEGEGLTVPTDQGGWTSAATVVETFGLVDQTIPEVQVIRTSVPWQYEIQQLDIVASGPVSVADIYLSLDTSTQKNGSSSNTSTFNATSITVVGASLLDPTTSAIDLKEAVEALPEAGKVRVSRVSKSSLANPLVFNRHLVTFITRGGDVPLLNVENWTIGALGNEEDDQSDIYWNATVKVTEIARGSLVDEVQKIHLRGNNSLINGTFRLEAESAVGRVTEDVRGYIGSEQDSIFWTSQLRFNSTAQEVETALNMLPNLGRVRVSRTANGDRRYYTTVSNGTIGTSNESYFSFQYWAWEVTFVEDGGDLPMLAAVWSDGRTGTNAGRASHRKCSDCVAFWPDTLSDAAQEVVGPRMEVEELYPGTVPISGTFSLVSHGHSYQGAEKTGAISVHAPAAALSSSLNSLHNIGKVYVSRSNPSPEGELSWTVTFNGGDGDHLALTPTVDEMGGTGALVHVTTIANGASPVRGQISLVVSGVSGQPSQATPPLRHDAPADDVKNALLGLKPVWAAGVSAKVERLGPSVGGGYKWIIAFAPRRSNEELVTTVAGLPVVGVQQANLTGTGAHVQVTHHGTKKAVTTEQIIATIAPLPPAVAEVQVLECSLDVGTTAVEAAEWGASFRISFRGENTEDIAPDAAISPDVLPECGIYGAGTCRGDGSTLKEKLEALETIGEVNVSMVTGGEKAVTLTFLDSTINSGEQPLLLAEVSNHTALKVSVSESTKGLSPFVNEVQKIILTGFNGTAPSGTFHLSSDQDRTVELVADTSANDMAAALRDLSDVANNITVAKSTLQGKGVDEPIDGFVWKITFGEPGPQILLTSSCEIDAQGKRSEDCFLDHEGVKMEVRRLVRGVTPLSGDFRIVIQAADSKRGTSGIPSDATELLSVNAAAQDVEGALRALPRGRNATVLRSPFAGAKHGWAWSISLHDGGASIIRLADTHLAPRVTWCTDGILGPAAGETPCEFPFIVDGNENGAHFSCAGAMGERLGWCATSPVFTEGSGWGGCKPCADSENDTSTIFVTGPRRSVRLTGPAPNVTLALSRVVYRPQNYWNSWISGHDDVTAVWDKTSDEARRVVGKMVTAQVLVSATNNPPALTIPAAPMPVLAGHIISLEGIHIADADLEDMDDAIIQVTVEATLGNLLVGNNRYAASPDDLPRLGSNSRVSLNATLDDIRTVLQHLHYQAPEGSTVGNVKLARREVQRVEVWSPFLPIVQSLSTQTTKGYIEGNFTLSLDCGVFFEVLEIIFSTVDTSNASSNSTFEAEYDRIVISPSLASDAPASGNTSVEAGVQSMLDKCKALTMARALYLSSLSASYSNSLDLYQNSTFTQDMLPYGLATAVVRRSEEDDHGGFTWAVSFTGVPNDLPTMTVASNNLTSNGTKSLNGSYALDSQAAKPAISVTLVQAGSSPSGPGGNFTLSLTGGQVSGPISSDASDNDFRVKLQALPNVGAIEVASGNLDIKSPAVPGLGRYWDITFLPSGYPPHAGDLPDMVVDGSQLTGAGASARVVELSKGQSPVDTLVVTVNDLGNFGDGGELTTNATWHLNIVPEDTAPTISIDTEGLLRGLEGSALQLPRISLAHTTGWEFSEEGHSNGPLYLLRVGCSKGNVSAPLSAMGSGVNTVSLSTTVVEFVGELEDLNHASSRLLFNAPPLSRGIVEVYIWATALGDWTTGGWGRTKFHILVDEVNSPPLLGAPRYLRAKGSSLVSFNGLSVTDDDIGGSFTIRIEVQHGLIHLPYPERLFLKGINEDAGKGVKKIVGEGTLDAVAGVLAKLSFTGPSRRFSGNDSVNITVTDGGGLSAESTVTVFLGAEYVPPAIVLQGQLATMSKPYHVDEDGIFRLDSVGVHDPDLAEDEIVQVGVFATQGVVSLTDAGNQPAVIVSDEGTGLSLAGTIRHVNHALQTLTYRPQPNVWGSDKLSILARRRGKGAGAAVEAEASIETLVVVIDPVNDPPKIILPSGAGANDERWQVAWAGETLSLSRIIVEDPDADDPAGDGFLSVNVSAGADAFLSVSFSNGDEPTPVVLFTEGDVLGMHHSVAFTGSPANIQAVLSHLEFYAPSESELGLRNITFWVSDRGNWGLGGEEQAVANLTLELKPRPVLPVSENISIQWMLPPWQLQVEEDGRLEVSGVELLVHDLADYPNMWVEAALSCMHGLIELTSVRESSDRLHVDREGPGSVLLNGPVREVIPALESWLYLPEADYNGLETVALSAQCQENISVNASLPIIVTAVHDPPVIRLIPPAMGGGKWLVEAGDRLALTGLNLEHADAVDQRSSSTLSLRAWSIGGKGVLHMDPVQPGLWVHKEDLENVLVVRGRLHYLQKALGSAALVYIPNEGREGRDTVGLTLTDDRVLRNLTQEVADSGEVWQRNGDLVRVLEVLITLPPMPPMVDLAGGGAYWVEEGQALHLEGLNVKAAIGFPDSSATPLVVNFIAEDGRITLPDVEGKEVAIQGQGSSNVTIVGLENTANSVLKSAVFTPNPLFNGVTRIEVSISQSTAESNEDKLYIAVAAVNNPPAIHLPSSTLSVDEDSGPLALVGVFITDPDAHEFGGGGVEVSFLVNPSVAGWLSFKRPVSSVTVLKGTSGVRRQSAFESTNLTLQGEVKNINFALEGLLFTPVKDFNGPASVLTNVNDLGATGRGGPLSANSTIYIDVEAVNDPPIISLPGEYRRNGGTGAIHLHNISVEDVDDLPTDTLAVMLYAKEGSIAVDVTSKVFVETTTVDGGALNGTVTMVGFQDDIRRAMSRVWYHPRSKGWQGIDTVYVNASDKHSNTGIASTYVIVANPAVPPEIVLTSERVVASEGEVLQLTGLSVRDPVASGAVEAGRSPPSFTVSCTAKFGALALAPVPQGISPLQEAAWATDVIASGHGLTGLFGTPRPTLAFRGSLSAVSAALDQLIYVSNITSNEDVVVLDLERMGTLEGMLDHREITVKVVKVNRPPKILWPTDAVPKELQDGSGVVLRGLQVIDEDIQGEALAVRLEVTIPNSTVLFPNARGGVKFINEEGTKLHGNLSSINAALSNIVVSSESVWRASTPSTMVVHVSDSHDMYTSLELALSVESTNSPPEVAVAEPDLTMKEGEVIERAGERAGVAVMDIDVLETPHGFLDVEVLTSHRSVLEVQNVTTSVAYRDPVQTVRTFSSSSGTTGNTSLGGTFNLTLDWSGMCGGCGVEGTGPIWHNAVANEDDVQSGLDTGYESGESLQAKLMAMPSANLLGIKISCRRDVQPDIDGGYEWHITFYGSPANLPLLVVESSLTGPAGASVQTAYKVIGNRLSGTFALSLGGFTTSAISFHATSEEVATALENLGSVSAVEVSSPSPADPQGGQTWLVTFFNALNGGDLPPLGSDKSGLHGIGASVEVTEVVKGVGIAELWEVRSSAAHINQVVEVTLSGLVKAEGYFQLGLDYHGQHAITQPIYPETVASAKEESGVWLHGGDRGQRKGESIESRLKALENWEFLGTNADVRVSRTLHQGGDNITWSITFIDAPEDLPVPTVLDQHLFGGEITSVKVVAHHNRVGGFFSLSYGEAKTNLIKYNISGADMAAALNDLSSLHSMDSGAGIVSVARASSISLEGGHRWTVAFLRDPEEFSSLHALGTAATTGLTGRSTQVSARLVRSGGRGAVLRLADPGGVSFAASSSVEGENIRFHGKPDQVSRVLSSLSYTPLSLWHGYADVIIRVNDGGLAGTGGVKSGWGSFTIAVDPVNNPPLVMWCDQLLETGGYFINGIDEDTSLRFVDYDCESDGSRGDSTEFSHEGKDGLGRSLSIWDVDSMGSSFEVHISVDVGELSLSAQPMEFVASDSSRGSSLTLSGFLPHINEALLTLAYTPKEDWHGWDKISVSVTDLREIETTAEGTDISDSRSIARILRELFVSVAAVNDAPVVEVSSLNATTLVDTEVNITKPKEAFLHSTEEDIALIITEVRVRDVDTEAFGMSLGLPDGFHAVDGGARAGDGAGLMTFEPHISLSLSCEHGLLSLVGGAGGLRIVQGDPWGGSRDLIILGSLAKVNHALEQGLRYRPDSNWYGMEGIQVHVDDRGNGGKSDANAAGSLTASAMLAVKVAPVNDPPVIIVPLRREDGGLLNAYEDAPGLVGTDCCGSTDQNLQGTSIISNPSIIIEDPDISIDRLTGKPGPSHPKSRWGHPFPATESLWEPDDEVVLTFSVRHGGIRFQEVLSEVTSTEVPSPGGDGTASAISEGFLSGLELQGPLWAVAKAVRGIVYRTDRNWNSWTGRGQGAGLGKIEAHFEAEEVSLVIQDSEGARATSVLSFIVLPENDPPVIDVQGARYDPGILNHDGISAMISSVDTVIAQEDIETVLPSIRVRDVDIGPVGGGSGAIFYPGDPVEVTLYATNGTLSLPKVTWIHDFLTGDGQDDQAMSFRATLTDVNEALGGLTYSGRQDHNGGDEVIITVRDLGRHGRGLNCIHGGDVSDVKYTVKGDYPNCPQSDTVTIPISILSQPDEPIILAPRGDFVEAIEDSDTVIEGFGIIEKDGVYVEGEMAGLMLPDLGDFHPSRVWPGQVQVEILVDNGQLTLSSTAGLAFDIGDGVSDERMVLTGHPGDVNRSLRRVVYRGDVHWNTLGRTMSGITVSVTNSHAGLGGLEPIAVQTVRTAWIKVSAVNDPPKIRLPGQAFRFSSATKWPELGGVEMGVVHPLLTGEDMSLDILGVSVTDVDLHERPGSTVFVTIGCQMGTLTLASSEGLSFANANISWKEGKVSFSGTVSFHAGLGNANAALRGLTYRPSPHWSGNETIVIAANDQGWSGEVSTGLHDEQSIPIHVRSLPDPPFLEAPLSPLHAEEDSASVVHGIRVSDPDGEAWLSVAISSEKGTVGLPRGSEAGVEFEEGTGEGEERLVVVGPEWALNTALQALIYVPPADWTSTNQGDAIHISVEDPSGLSAHSRLVVIVASGHNDPPQVHVPGARYVEEPCVAPDGLVGELPPQHPAHQAYQCRRITSVDRLTAEEDLVLAVEGIYIEDPDVEEGGSGATVEVELYASHGSLGFTGADRLIGITFLAGTVPGKGHVIFRGSLAMVNAALGRLTYSGDPDWNGADEILVSVDDMGFTGSGGPKTDWRSIPVDVVGKNDRPLLVMTPQVQGKGWMGNHETFTSGATTSTVEVLEDSRVTLHNVTLYDAEVNPRQLHEQVLGLPKPHTPYANYPIPGGVEGEGLYRITVESGHGRVLFPWTAGLMFESPAWEAEEERRGQSTHLTEGRTFMMETSEGANMTTMGATGTDRESRPGAPQVLWWQRARFTGRLEDCNRALEAMSYWPNLNWNGVDIVKVRAEEASVDNIWAVGNHTLEDEISVLVRVVPANDPPVVTPPFPHRHQTLREPDLLSLAVVSADWIYVDEDGSVAIPGFEVRDVDLEEDGGVEADITVTVTARNGQVSIPWHGKTDQPGIGTGPLGTGAPNETHQSTGLIFFGADGNLISGERLGGVGGTVVFRASLSDANQALGSMFFFPDNDFFGPDAWVQVEAWDGGLSGGVSSYNTGSGQSWMDGDRGGRGSAIVPITVRPVNDPPSLTLPFSEDGHARLWLDEGEERRVDGAHWHGAMTAAVAAAGHLDSRTGSELWRSQGTFPGLDSGRWGKGEELEWKKSLVLDIHKGLGDSSPQHFKSWGGYLFFQARKCDLPCFDETHGAELWRTDGTGAGTVLVKDIFPGEKGSEPAFLTPFDGYLYFQACNADGLDTGWMVAPEHRDECGCFRQSVFDPRVFFADTTWDIRQHLDCPDGYHWASTSQGGELFTGKYEDDRGDASVEPLVYFGQCGWDGYEWGGHRRTHFRFSDSHSTGAYKHAGRRESYQPDFDADLTNLETSGFAGIVCLANIGSIYTNGGGKVETAPAAEQPCRWGERSNGGCHLRSGKELWRTDGTSAGTRRMDDIGSGVAGAAPAFLTFFDGALFFAAYTDLFGTELYRSDGQPGGAELVEDIARGHASSSPRHLVSNGESTLFFTADDGIAGRELWRSDGALGFLGDEQVHLGFPSTGGAGTRRVRDIRPGSLGSEPLYLTWEPSTSLLFFSADDGDFGRELWSSDGTGAGTVTVADICHGTRGSFPAYLTAWGGQVFFRATDCSSGAELWSSDGTRSGTRLLHETRTGSAGGFPSFLTVLNPAGPGLAQLFFIVESGLGVGGLGGSGKGGGELWRTDGTSDGTRRALGQLTGTDFQVDEEALEAGWPAQMAVFGGALYLPASRDPLVAVERIAGQNEKFEEGIPQALVVQDVDAGP